MHKTIALLWQIVLMVGAENVQRFCRSVRALVTDMGAERIFVRAPIGILQNFMRHIGADVYIRTDSPCVFPGALLVPGWKHAIDLLLSRGLWLLPYIPKFVKQAKAMVAFLREDLQLVCENFRGRGLAGLAALLENETLPTFANWRWATLDRVLQCLSRLVWSLALVFDAKPFRNSQDTTRVKSIAETLASEAWMSQLVFVSWYTNVMTKLLDWVGGCRCHGLETTPAERASCNWKGRRLPEAHAHATSTLRGAMEEVNSWTPEMLRGYELLRQGQACMRGTFLLSLEKLQFLDELPCLLVRLDQPGVRDRCQWDVDGCSRGLRSCRS